MRFPWLNLSQEEAVNHVLAAKDVSIVHGPPGTGKTTTLVEAIYETLHRENQVMVCAQSNTAVDWISEKLVDRGIHVRHNRGQLLPAALPLPGLQVYDV